MDEIATADSNTAETHDDRAARYMKNILGEKVVCTLDDGRKATGQFICMDRLCVSEV